MRRETVLIVYQYPRILLGMKKERFGKGKYNGFGGKVEKGESLEESVIREAQEEAGIIIINPERFGEILFQFENSEPDHLVNFFRATEFNGTPRESDEMRPKWFHINKIPYNKMWEDDKYWLPLLLENQKFRGKFYFNNEFKIVKYELNKVNKLE